MVLKFNNAQIREFWQQHDRFLKTTLITETPNPLTHDLSNLCVHDTRAAFELFKTLELNAIDSLQPHINCIKSLQKDIYSCLKQGGKIYLAGCGASGRLAMLLKRLWQQLPYVNLDQVVSVSAGGDVSLIKAVEQFEDKGQFGIKQLLSQGFDLNNDLLIGLSSSGESPFIISAIKYVADNGKHKPYLICNNSIASILERNPESIVGLNIIHTLALDVGAMALTGSTRLAATSAMHIALGLAMSHNSDIEVSIQNIKQEIQKLPLSQLATITNSEARALKDGEHVLYRTQNMLLGLSLLADITERSPTFNLATFENEYNHNVNPCPFYLAIDSIHDKTHVWKFLFGHSPYALNWKNYPTTSSSYIEKFDLSSSSPRAIGKYLAKPQHTVIWHSINNHLKINFQDNHLDFNLPQCELTQSLIYKICLNSHSTILFGILGYFEGNMMLSLKPSNFKLIDRAIRYSTFILKNKHNLHPNYKEVAEVTFKEINRLCEGQSIVKKVVAQFTSKIQ